MHKILALTCIAALSIAGVAEGQFPGSWSPTAADCQNAADSLVAGSKNSQAWSFAHSCGAQGAVAVGQAIQSVQSQTDTTYLADLLTLATTVQHPAILDASISLAANKSATLSARAFALLVMAGQYGPTYDVSTAGGWGALTTTPSCAYFLSPEPFSASYPMPNDWLERIASSSEQISSDAADAASIRALATCVRRLLLARVPSTVDPAKLQLEYVCRSEFRVSSTATKQANLIIRVEGWPDPIGITVAGPGVATFATPVVGTVRMYQGSQLIATQSNQQTQCP